MIGGDGRLASLSVSGKMDGHEGCCGSAEKSEMIPAEEALGIVLGVSKRLTPVLVSLQEALGKVLAEDIRAPDPLPPYPASVKVNSIQT